MISSPVWVCKVWICPWSFLSYQIASVDMTRGAPEFHDGKTHTVVGFFVMSTLGIALGYVFATHDW